MVAKLEVVVVDVLMKNETKHSDMIDIMSQMQDYLGQDYPSDHRILSEDQLTTERQVSAKHHIMDGDTVREWDFLNQSQKTGTGWFACYWYVTL